MAMPWSVAIYLMKMVWVVLNGWISSCLIIADEIARALRATAHSLTTHDRIGHL